jgi:Mrp family chromosome partitioning ATPase/capsular polysaccharide biosynthesis protein
VNETPRYSSLRDYLRVLRAQRLLIIGVTIAFAAAAFVISSLQSKEYAAQASLSFRDISQDLSLVGQGSIPQQTPDQRAAINADLVTRPSIATRVRQTLDPNLSVGQIQGAISTQVGTRTNFVIIQATWKDPNFAARLANAYAQEVLRLNTEGLQHQIDNATTALQSKAKSAADRSPLEQQVIQEQIARLQTVRELARPVEIAKPATAPAQPSSPRTKRNAVLGGLIGLAFGLLAAFMRDSLDRRLRNTDEVQAELHLPVIGRVPDDALGQTGFANGAVADAGAHLEAFRMLRTNLEFLQAGSPMKTVMVTSGSPEEGKSTVAMALAGAAAVAGKRTLLVECDLRRPCFADRLGISAQPGLTDYLVGQASPADILQVVKLGSALQVNGNGMDAGEEEPDGYASMVCITAGSNTQMPAEMLGSERFANFLEKVSTAYDLVVLDTSPILAVVDALELAPQVDGLVVCVRLSRTTREEARAARDALGHLPGRPTGVVVTGVRAREDAYYGYTYGASPE